ncbi:hypothetical protein Tco_1234163 [Tanacetum coccineum]
MINQRVDAALEARRVNRDLRVGNRNDNRGGDGNGNGNGNGTGNGNNGGDDDDGNENRNVNGRGDRPGARECRWSEKMETVYGVKRWKLCFTSATVRKDIREQLKLMTEVYCPRNEIQKMETEL